MLKTVHSIYIKCKNFNLKYCYFGRILSEIARYTAFSILFLLPKAKNSHTIATNTSLSAACDMSIFVLSFPTLSTLQIFYPTRKESNISCTLLGTPANRNKAARPTPVLVSVGQKFWKASWYQNTIDKLRQRSCAYLAAESTIYRITHTGIQVIVSQWDCTHFEQHGNGTNGKEHLFQSFCFESATLKPMLTIGFPYPNCLMKPASLWTYVNCNISPMLNCLLE